VSPFRAGQTIVLRALDHMHRPLIGIPVTVVEDARELVAIHLRPGIRVQWYSGADMGGPRGRGILEWHGEHEERNWLGSELLILKRPGEWHSVQIMWTPGERTFLGWYINMEEPSRRTARGFDIRDLELDIEIAPDLSWHWKDEDVFEWAIDEGRIPRADRSLIQAEGEQALQRVLRREPPFDRDWETWRPDPTWVLPTLPSDWDR
jgi:hypothetical protein